MLLTAEPCNGFANVGFRHAGIIFAWCQNPNMYNLLLKVSRSDGQNIKSANVEIN